MSKLTPRRLLVLIDELPGDSAYKTAVRDRLSDDELAELAARPRDKHGRWSHEALLLAAMIDRLEMLRRDLVSLNQGEIKTPFTPVPRPGVTGRKVKRAINSSAAQAMRAIVEEHARLHGYKIDDKGFPIQDTGTG